MFHINKIFIQAILSRIGTETVLTFAWFFWFVANYFSNCWMNFTKSKLAKYSKSESPAGDLNKLFEIILGISLNMLYITCIIHISLFRNLTGLSLSKVDYNSIDEHWVGQQHICDWCFIYRSLNWIIVQWINLNFQPTIFTIWDCNVHYVPII